MKTATFVIPLYIEKSVYLGFLEETLQSLMGQTDKNWNAILIDDCSPLSEVKETISKYMQLDQRIHCIFLTERKSTGACRNLGIEWAYNNKSSFVLFNDADDIAHPTRLCKVRSIFEENQDISVVYTNVKIINENTDFVERGSISPAILEILDELNDAPPVGDNCWYDIGVKAGYINVTSATAVKTELAMKELFPDEYVSEDSNTWYRYAARGKLYYINEALTFYRLPSFVKRQSSASYVSDFNACKLKVDIEGFDKALDIARQAGKIDQDNYYLIRAKFLMRLAQSMGNDGRYDLAYQVSMECQKTLNMVKDSLSNVQQ